MGSGKINILKDIISNYTSGRRYDLSYVVENADWVIRQDGKQLTDIFNKLRLIKSRITTSAIGIKNQIVHFGSLNTFLTENGVKLPHYSNKIALTIFHIVPREKRLRFLTEAAKHIAVVHTSANSTKNHLLEIGIPETKIIVIPLGIDPLIFNPVSDSEKKSLREAMGMPPDSIVIGSFQKDGLGWGEGLEPKSIKGPDIFLQVAEKLNQNHNVFVLLSGPARGYVKEGLKKSNIAYRHIPHLKQMADVARLYGTLDLYLITSRIEGGPKQILESWASGVPVVSTRVGMVPDIATEGKNVLFSDIENVDQIVKAAEEIINNKELKNKLIIAGLEKVKDYSWDLIAKRYFDEIYKKL